MPLPPTRLPPAEYVNGVLVFNKPIRVSTTNDNGVELNVPPIVVEQGVQISTQGVFVAGKLSAAELGTGVLTATELICDDLIATNSIASMDTLSVSGKTTLGVTKIQANGQVALEVYGADPYAAVSVSGTTLTDSLAAFVSLAVLGKTTAEDLYATNVFATSATLTGDLDVGEHCGRGRGGRGWLG